MRILATLLMLTLLACGSIGDTDAQQVNEIKTDALLVGPSTGATAFLSVNRSTQLIMQQTGNFTGSGGTVMGFYQSPTLITGQGLSAYSTWMNPVLTKAAAGVHPDFATLTLSPPTVNGGAATVTTAETLNILNAPTGGVTNRSIWVQAGLSEFSGGVKGTTGVFSGDVTSGGANGFKTTTNATGLYFNGTRNAITGDNASDTVTIGAANATVATFTSTGAAITGTLSASTGGAVGSAVCWKADGITLGHCTSAVGAGGTCTCA